MSGRLTILPKKTYCPWKQENIERVLRDERLERERIEKESAANAKHKQQQRLQQSRRDCSIRRDGNGVKDEESINKEKGHINLFPEAKEAELRLANGSSLSNQQQHHTNNNNGKVDESGVAPIPLGGNESINRKVGNVPFYMRSTTTATTSTTSAVGSSTGTTSNVDGEERYINTNNSFRLGTRRSTNTNNNPNNNTDAITTKLMQDQYIQREDYRKRNMDPMSRFYVDVNPPSREGVYAKGRSDMNVGNGIIRDRDTTSKQTDIDLKSSVDEDVKEKKHRKKKRRKRSYSSDNSTSSSSDIDRDRHKHKKRKHKSKKTKRSSSRHHEHHHEKRRHHDKSSSRDSKTELEELRRRRHAREANERERLNNSRGDVSSSFDGSTIQTKDTRCYDGSNGFH